MPRCPYYKEELRVKLSALFISKIDDNYENALAAFIDQGPRFFKSFIKSQINMVRKYLILLNALSCDIYSAVLDLESQNRGSLS